MAKQTKSGAGASRPEMDLNQQKRATSAAWWGLAMQLLLALVAIVLWNLGGGRTPLLTVFTFAFLGLIPWLATLVATAFRRAKTLEDFELEAARRTGDIDRTIFASEVDARPALRRLNRVYKWVLPAAAVLLGVLLAWRGYHGAQAALENRAYDLTSQYANARYLAGLFAGFAFVGFVLGRYLLGMSASPAWAILRGGATYLIGTVYIFALMALASGAAALGTDAVNSIVRYIVPIFALLVGVEVVLNVVLDLYRPKSAGEAPRPAFDSRLLSLLASPGDVVQSLNEAVNYQFGFEITRSWFWRLLSRSFGWLVLFGVGVLVLLSSVVIVEPHELALKTSLGNLQQEPLEPGVHLKWPWPLAMVDKYEVTRVEEMVVGSHDDFHPEAALLWTNQHAGAEELLLVAGGTSRGGVRDQFDPEELRNVPRLPTGLRSGGGGAAMMSVEVPDAPVDAAALADAPSVGLAAADVLVQWKINPEQLIQYATSAANPEQRLRQLANAAVTRELLKHDIDAVIGVQRPTIGRAIETRLKEAVERERLGIQILWVGLVSVHPPQAVAEEFNLAAAAVQAGLQVVEQGRQEQTRLLTEAAGSVAAAQRIVAEHRRLESLRQQLQRMRQQTQPAAPPEQVEELEAQVVAQQAELERLIQQAGGAAARQLLSARQQRWEAENGALAEAAVQPVEYEAYRQAPRYYWHRRYLEILGQTMADKRKYMLLNDDANPLIDLDLRATIDAFTGLTVPQRDIPEE